MAQQGIEDRLAAIEARLASIESGVLPALRALAPDAGKSGDERPLGRRVLGGLGKLVVDVAPGLILLAVGYALIQSVQLGLERERVHAESAEKVREFVQYLYDGPAPGEADRRRSTAIALGAFGRVAVVPLVLIMEENGIEQINAARAGLVSAGRVERGHTCAVLASVVGDATRAYHWETHKNVTEVMGRVACPDAAEALGSLCSRVAEGLDDFNATVRKGVPDKAALDELEAVVATALVRVGAAVPAGRCGAG